MQLLVLERIQEYEPKYDLWPYKRRNIEGSITTNYRCADLTTMQIHQEMWPAERTHFHQNMTFDPIKDGTLGAALPKTIGV